MITRTAEIKELQKLYEEEGSQVVLLYGSSCSGEAQLIGEFCGDKEMFYYHARNASEDKQLQMLAEEIRAEYRVEIEEPTFDACFSQLVSKTGAKLVVVLKDFLAMARRSETFWKSLFRLKDGKLGGGNVLILLHTSSLSWVRKEMDEVLGRNLKKIDLGMGLFDLSFLDLVRTFPGYSVSESVQTYGIIGGVPAYLERWDGKRSVKKNVCSLILDPLGIFHEEAERVIKEELRELSVYDTILAAMARGHEKLNDLYEATGFSRAKISVYLKNLAAFDIVEKIVSFDTGGWEHTKKGVYRIKHHLIDFWFHFIYPHMSDLDRMRPEDFFDVYVEPKLDAYLRRYFVDVCKEYLLLLNRVGKVPIHIDKIGTWIGKKGTIDVVGRDATRDCVVCLTNWDAPEMEYARYEQLLSDLDAARIRAKRIYLFSARSFAKELKELEQQSDMVELVDMTEL